MAFLLSGKLFLINYFHFKVLSRTLLEVSSTQLFAPTCKITVLGTFCSKGLRLLRMSSNYVSRQNLVVTWCWLVNRPSSIHEIRESLVINTASLGHFCELNCVEMWQSVTAFKFSFCNLDSSWFGWCHGLGDVMVWVVLFSCIMYLIFYFLLLALITKLFITVSNAIARFII